MTWISWLGVYHCQSLLNNKNRKLVCLESLCYCGVTRYNKTEAFLCLGRRRIFRNWFCSSHTPAVDHAGMWERAVAFEESSASLRLQRDISALALCPSMCFLLLGLGLWREHGWRKRIFQWCPRSVWSCVSDVQGGSAGLPSPAVQGGRRGVEHNRECALHWPGDLGHLLPDLLEVAVQRMLSMSRSFFISCDITLCVKYYHQLLSNTLY